jgi:hypothetical protein
MQPDDARLALKTFLAVDPPSRRDWFETASSKNYPGLLRTLRSHMPLVTFRRNDQLGEIVIDRPPPAPISDRAISMSGHLPRGMTATPTSSIFAASSNSALTPNNAIAG